MSDAAHEACGLLIRIGRTHHRLVEARVKGLGIHPAQHFALMHLARAGEKLSQAQVAEALHVSAPGVARTLKALEADGTITRAGSEKDARRNEVLITEKGKEIVRKSKIEFDAIEDAGFEGLSDQELATLNSLLTRVLANLNALKEKTDEKESNE